MSLHNIILPATGTITFKIDSRDDFVIDRTFNKSKFVFSSIILPMGKMVIWVQKSYTTQWIPVKKWFQES